MAPFEELLRRERPDWTHDRVSRLVRFRELVVAENEVQNLTRIVEPEAFFDSHVIDGEKVVETPAVEFPAMDLGSGLGVPGLVSAILRADPWVIVESEKRKAEFLERVKGELGLDSVRVVADRGEDWLKSDRVNSIVVRAVGPVDRIYGWLRARSTWNNLVLLKSKGWEAEWEAFRASPFASELEIASDTAYHSPLGGARRMVRLNRVPRRTNP
jgi:16S rRNA (guanine527-N7)-methyltransferase